GGAPPDGWTETAPAYCFGTGHGMVQLQMAPDGMSFTTVPGAASQTDFGNPIGIDGTYVGGGTEPRSTPTLPAPQCSGGPWPGLWVRSEIPGVATLVQKGSTVTGSYDWGSGGGISGTISGSTLSGTWTGAGGPGPFSF